jgi:hypothetical protein
MAAERLAGVGEERHGTAAAEGEHSAGQVARVQFSQRAASGLEVLDDDGGQRLARSRLERRLPSFVDRDQVEQRAEHAGHAGQRLGTGARASLV